MNVTGHGSVNQMADLDEVEAKVTVGIASLNEKFGRWKWLAVYGGDPYNAKKPDVALVLRIMHQRGLPVLAVQCEEYASYMIGPDGGVADVEAYGHLCGGGALIYQTARDRAGKILFGGYDPQDGVSLVGTTRIVFDLIADGAKNVAHMCFGGGKISIDEFDGALNRGFPCIYIPVKAKTQLSPQDFCSAGMPTKEMELDAQFGVMRTYCRQEHLLEETWVQFDTRPLKQLQDKGMLRERTHHGGYYQVDSARSVRDIVGYPTTVLAKQTYREEVKMAVDIERVWGLDEQVPSIECSFCLRLCWPKSQGMAVPSIRLDNLIGALEPTWEDVAGAGAHTSEWGADGTHLMWEHTFSGTFIQRFDSESREHFPWGNHAFSLEFRAGDIEITRLGTLRTPCAIFRREDYLTDWRVALYKNNGSGWLAGERWAGVRFGVSNARDKFTNMSSRVAIVQFAATRDHRKLMQSLMVPALLTTAASMLMFWLPIEAIGERWNTVNTMFLAIVALRASAYEGNPGLSRNSLLDTYLHYSTLLLLGAGFIQAPLTSPDWWGWSALPDWCCPVPQNDSIEANRQRLLDCGNSIMFYLVAIAMAIFHIWIGWRIHESRKTIAALMELHQLTFDRPEA